MEGDTCEVLIDLFNPLPFELKVSNMVSVGCNIKVGQCFVCVKLCFYFSQRLLASDVVFESIPSSIVLPADSGPHTISLEGVPKEVGELEIQGAY